MKIKNLLLVLLLLFNFQFSIAVEKENICVRLLSKSLKVTDDELIEYLNVFDPSRASARKFSDLLISLNPSPAILSTSELPFASRFEIKFQKSVGELSKNIDRVDLNNAYSFIASNEFDWYKMEVDNEKTDLLIGFGSTMAWDLAVRKDAKNIVFVDITSAPLIAQKYLFQPLILASNSRAEFLEYLFGFPLQEELTDKNFGNELKHINWTNIKSNNLDLTEFHMLKFLKKLSKSPYVTKEQLEFIAGYYSNLLYSEGSDPFTYRQQDMYKSKLFVNSTNAFFATNLPAALLRRHSAFMKKVDPNLKVNSEMYSALESEASFQRLKSIFKNGVYYIQANMFDNSVYSDIKNIGDSLNAKSYTVNMTNIVDLVFDTDTEKEAVKKQLMQTWAELFASKEHPLTVFNTIGVRDTHVYERFRISNKNEIKP